MEGLGLAKDVIVVDKLTYYYPHSEEPALKGINLKVKQGEIVTIMGHTGCGKSTLCLTFNGVIPHAIGGDLEGKVLIDGLDVMEHDIPELARRVGMVFQDPETQLFSVTVKSEVAFGPENLMLPREEIIERVDWALEATRLKGYEERAPTKLSGGEKQQVALAAAMAMRPKILVLDEPTSELDPVGTRKIFSLIKELNERYGITFVIIEHKEEAVRLSDRIILMKDGKVIGEGRPPRVFSEIDSVKESRVRVPQISQLFYKLKERGLDIGRLPLSTEEAYRILKDLLDKEKAEDLPVEASKRDIESQPVIKTKDLFFQYKNGPVALKRINLEVYQGEFTAIIGQNGAGKTTLAKHFNGLLKPTKGDVIIDGMNTKDALITDLAKTVGFVFQNPDHQFFSFTVEEEVAFGPRNLGLSEEEVKSRVDEALRMVGLEQMRNRHPFTLSRGQRQRLAVASVLAMHPKIIVLDEPTTGQDEVAINQIMTLVNKLREEGRTILMITHDMSIVTKYAERTIVLCQGEVLLDGPTREVFSHPEILEKSHIDIPPIMKLARMLSDYGIPSNVLTVEEMCDMIMRKAGG